MKTNTKNYVVQLDSFLSNGYMYVSAVLTRTVLWGGRYISLSHIILKTYMISGHLTLPQG